MRGSGGRENERGVDRGESTEGLGSRGDMLRVTSRSRARMRTKGGRRSRGVQMMGREAEGIV